jgi:hypothetical protein
MVREDGEQLYLINKECDWRKPFNDDWHRSTTLPTILPYITGPQALTREQIARRILIFTGSLTEIKSGTFAPAYPAPRLEFWAYHADYDWVVLCQLFGRMIDLPNGFPKYCRDFKQLLDEHDFVIVRPGLGAHNALADALWLKREYDSWMRQRDPTPTTA